MTLKKPQLIKRVIKSLGVKNSNPTATPVVKPFLIKVWMGKKEMSMFFIACLQLDLYHSWQDTQDLILQWKLAKTPNAPIFQKHPMSLLLSELENACSVRQRKIQHACQMLIKDWKFL